MTNINDIQDIMVKDTVTKHIGYDIAGMYQIYQIDTLQIEDGMKHPWTGPLPWYEKLNCFQEIYDENGNHVGRESEVRLNYHGLRALKTIQYDPVGRCKKRITCIICIQYPQDWA